MNSPLPHPAVAQLLRYQMVAHARRMFDRLATPKRIVLSLVALILAVVWLGNAAASVVLRSAFDPGMLQRYLPMGLLAYALWHVVKAAYQRPEAGIEWNTAEQEMLWAKPLRPRDLVLYRFATIALSALVKASLMTLIMLPDLHVPWAGWIGAILALLFIDLWRMGVEITAWGMPGSLYRKLRVGLIVSLVVLAASGVVVALRSPAGYGALQSPGAIQLAMLSLESLARFGDTAVGDVLLSVPYVFTQVILADRVDVPLFAWLLLATASVALMGWFVIRLDGYFREVTRRRERSTYGGLGEAESPEAERHAPHLAAIPRLAGLGVIIWRQLLGVRRYGSSVLVALAVPGVLSCLPWLARAGATATLWNVTGGLAFYSFLLLPSALRFDFRRELDRMVLLKSLPLRSSAVVLGQLFTPVFIAGALQTAVLLATAAVFPAPPHCVVTAILMLLLSNVLIFALDNLIYLWFPHRLNQEGIVIFLRTTLTFTAKGLLFAAALAVVFGWALASTWMASNFGVRNELVFAAGLLTLFVASSAVLIVLLIRAYDRFDPSQDVPS